MPKVLRGLGMFVHGEILPIYQAVPILRMGAGINIRVSCLKVCSRVQKKKKKSEAQSLIFSVKIQRI